MPPPALKQSSSDNAEEEDLPASLPPPMDIVEVGSKLETNSGLVSLCSDCDVLHFSVFFLHICYHFLLIFVWFIRLYIGYFMYQHH